MLPPTPSDSGFWCIAALDSSASFAEGSQHFVRLHEGPQTQAAVAAPGSKAKHFSPAQTLVELRWGCLEADQEPAVTPVKWKVVAGATWCWGSCQHSCTTDSSGTFCSSSLEESKPVFSVSGPLLFCCSMLCKRKVSHTQHMVALCVWKKKKKSVLGKKTTANAVLKSEACKQYLELSGIIIIISPSVP